MCETFALNVGTIDIKISPLISKVHIALCISKGDNSTIAFCHIGALCYLIVTELGLHSHSFTTSVAIPADFISFSCIIFTVMVSEVA